MGSSAGSSRGREMNSALVGGLDELYPLSRLFVTVLRSPFAD